MGLIYKRICLYTRMFQTWSLLVVSFIHLQRDNFIYNQNQPTSNLPMVHNWLCNPNPIDYFLGI